VKLALHRVNGVLVKFEVPPVLLTSYRARRSKVKVLGGKVRPRAARTWTSKPKIEAQHH